MHPVPRCLLLLVLACSGSACFAQAVDPAKFLDDAREQIADIRKQLGGEVDEAKLGEYRDAVGAIASQAAALADERQPKLAAIEARLAELGPAPDKGASEATDIAAQRRDLEQQRRALDAEIKRARLAVVDSQQVTATIAEARRANFQARLSQRTASPLAPAFWRGLADNLKRDRARLSGLRDGMVAALRDSFSPDNRVFAFGGIVLGLLLVCGRWWGERALMRLSANRVPQGRLRRTGVAFAIVLMTTACATLGTQAIISGFDWNGAFSEVEKGLARALLGAVFFGSLITGLGRALLSATRPSWRLPPIGDAVARRLRPLPLLLGGAAAFAIVQARINALVGTSLSATIAGSLIVALLYSLLIGWGLLRAARTRAPAHDGDLSRRPAWVGFAIAALWLGVLACLLAALAGYVALAHQIARQMVGLGLVAAVLYLLVHLIEDICATALSARAKWARRTFGFDQRVLDQVAVVGSGLFRVFALLLGVMAVLAPFGTEPADMIARFGQVGSGLKIGQFELTPAAVSTAIVVFVLGLAAIRALQRWLLETYLPTTRIEPGMRSSVTTLLGYAGGVVVFAFALSALGLSLDRIAWVASALSVGIGFGLQAIVQNFVSGLILLIERPVKVGDWVVLGDAEGDIRRISVRATEIQMGDRSTVIVPNSELITKSVRNVTLANAEGRVRIRLPLPLDSDAARVRSLVQAALAAHGGVLPTPEPSVLLDGIESGTLVFVAIAYIDNPRHSGSVRSELLFDILARLRAEHIALATPYQINVQARPGQGTADTGGTLAAAIDAPR